MSSVFSEAGLTSRQLVTSSTSATSQRGFTHSLYRVFLTGKDHVSYRRVLNNLFTHKALG